MGLIRSAGLTIIAILIFLMLLVTNSLLTITMSLDYQTLEPELVSVASEIIVEQGADVQISEALPLMQEGCINQTNYNFSHEGELLDIPCETVNQGEDAVIQYAISTEVNKVYYRDYDCESPWNCGIGTDDMATPFVSKMAHDYWKSKFNLALGITIALIVLGLLIAEGRKNYPFLLGGLFILAALPFIKVSWFFSLFTNFEVARMLGVMFSKSFSVFLIMAITGVVLILLGVAIKFVGIGNWIYKITGGEKRAMKKEIKDEVKKDMKSKKK